MRTTLVASRGRVRSVQRDKERERNRRGIEKERDRKKREGMIFAREGCAIRRVAAQNRSLRSGRRAHFPPSFWPS